MRRMTTVAVTAVALTLAGCGGGSSGSQSANSVPKASISPTATQDVAADKAAAQAAVLTLADFPAGWTTRTDDDSDSDSEKADRQVAKCLGLTVAELNAENPTMTESPDFEDAGDHTIASSVEYEPTVAEVNDSWAQVSDPKVPACLQVGLAAYFDEMIKHPKSEADQLPQGVTIGKPRVGQTSFPTVGDMTVAYRVTVPMTAQGVSVEVYMDLIAAAKGRAIVQLIFMSAQTPPETSIEQHYTKTIVDRLSRTTDPNATHQG